MILYRHDSHTPASWMQPGTTATKVEAKHVFATEPLCYAPDLATLKWYGLGDGWEVAGEGMPAVRETYSEERHEVIGADGSRVPILPVIDRRGNTWYAPAILSPDGAVLLTATFRRIDGQMRVEYDPRQQAMIDLARKGREEFTKEEVTLTQSIAAEFASDFLAFAYYVHPEAPGALGLLDEVMVVDYIFAAAGIWPDDG